MKPLILKLKSFLRGMYEFRDDITSGFDNTEVQKAYDWGREWAHRITLRIWDK